MKTAFAAIATALLLGACNNPVPGPQSKDDPGPAASPAAPDPAAHVETTDSPSQQSPLATGDAPARK